MRRSYKFWKVGGGDFTNTHMIVDFWFLMCNDPFEPDLGLGLADAGIVTGIHKVSSNGDFIVNFPTPFKTTPVVTLTAHGNDGKSEACLTNVVTDFGNILKPDGKLGNAMNFAWTSAIKGNGPGKTPNSAAQAATQRKYYQQGPASNLWISVALPQAVECYQTALVGYPSSHEPTSGAYIAASNDGQTWTTILSWDKHKGASTAYLHTSYSAAAGGLGKYGMKLDTSKGSFRYWRTGASTFTNKHMIVDYWILNCRQPSFGGVARDKFSARIITHNGAWDQGYVHWMAAEPGKQDLYIDAQAATPSYRVQRGIFDASSNGNKQIKFNPPFPSAPTVVLTSMANGRHGNTCISPGSVTTNGFIGRMINHNGAWDTGKIMWTAIYKTVDAGRRALGSVHTEDDYQVLLHELTGLHEEFETMQERMEHLEDVIARIKTVNL